MRLKRRNWEKKLTGEHLHGARDEMLEVPLLWLRAGAVHVASSTTRSQVSAGQGCVDRQGGSIHQGNHVEDLGGLWLPVGVDTAVRQAEGAEGLGADGGARLVATENNTTQVVGARTLSLLIGLIVFRHVENLEGRLILAG